MYGTAFLLAAYAAVAVQALMVTGTNTIPEAAPAPPQPAVAPLKPFIVNNVKSWAGSLYEKYVAGGGKKKRQAMASPSPSAGSVGRANFPPNIYFPDNSKYVQCPSSNGNTQFSGRQLLYRTSPSSQQYLGCLYGSLTCTYSLISGQLIEDPSNNLCSNGNAIVLRNAASNCFNACLLRNNTVAAFDYIQYVSSRSGDAYTYCQWRTSSGNVRACTFDPSSGQPSQTSQTSSSCDDIYILSGLCADP